MTATDYLNIIEKAAQYIQSIDGRKPQIAIVLGTGLDILAQSITDATIIPYTSIPGFPKPTAIGHKGQFIIGNLAGLTVIAMAGRYHYYEGYTMWQVTLPHRVMFKLGASRMIVTNAVGGLNQSYQPGDIMIIKDHINLLPSPLIGLNNIQGFGSRFPDMSHPYSKQLIGLADEAAAQLGHEVQHGVLTSITGPEFETPSECRRFLQMGADAVGMSSIPEVIVARQMGVEVLGISMITDMALFDRGDDFRSDPDEVLKMAKESAHKIADIITYVVNKLS